MPVPFRNVPMTFVAAAAAGLAVLSAASPAAAGGAGAGGGWVNAPGVPVPPKSPDVALRDVAVLGPADVWTVGVTGTLPFTARLTGAAWTRVPFPGAADLQAVDAAAPDDVWAGGSELGRPVLARWNGTAWATIGTVAPPGAIFGIDLLPGGDGWAVGSVTSPAGPLVLHRAAGVWSAEPVRAPAGTTLKAVAAVNATDAWAVGSRPGPSGQRVPVVLHRTAPGWAEVPLPAISSAALDGVAVGRDGDAWAAGSACTPDCGTYALHLGQAGVQLLPSTRGYELHEAVVPCRGCGTAPTDVWLLGTSAADPSGPFDHVEHWDGTTLTIDTTTPPMDVQTKSGSGISLAAADADPAGTTLWAVGWTQLDATADRVPRVMHRNLP